MTELAEYRKTQQNLIDWYKLTNQVGAVWTQSYIMIGYYVFQWNDTVTDSRDGLVES